MFLALKFPKRHQLIKNSLSEEITSCNVNCKIYHMESIKNLGCLILRGNRRGWGDGLVNKVPAPHA